MTDQVLTILRFVLLGLLYIFFARVLWAVWTEVRTAGRRPIQGPSGPPPGQVVSRSASTTPMARPGEPTGADTKRSRRERRDAKSDAKAAKKSARQLATRLVFLEPQHRQGTEIALGVGELVFGRDPTCDLSIQDDSFVSSRHFRTFDFDGQPMIEDLGSTNGTYHNGNKLIGARLLHPGDRIQVGSIVIEAR